MCQMSVDLKLFFTGHLVIVFSPHCAGIYGWDRCLTNNQSLPFSDLITFTDGADGDVES